MEKIITEAQLKDILNGLFRINPPVQFYTEVAKLFESLPVYKKAEEKVKNPEK